jgi:hypothetical protein
MYEMQEPRSVSLHRPRSAAETAPRGRAFATSALRRSLAAIVPVSRWCRRRFEAALRWLRGGSAFSDK